MHRARDMEKAGTQDSKGNLDSRGKEKVDSEQGKDSREKEEVDSKGKERDSKDPNFQTECSQWYVTYPG